METITELLRSFVNFNGTDWDLLLPSLCFAYNDSINSATGFSPLFLMHGEHPASPFSILGRGLLDETGINRKQETVINFVRRIGENIIRTRLSIEKNRAQMETQMQTRSRQIDLKPGNLVLLHRKAAGVTGNKLGKLGPRWIGPFRVIEQRHGSAVLLDLPPIMAIDPVVNLRFIKPYRVAHKTDLSTPSVTAPISEITDYRIVPDGDDFYRLEFQIKTTPDSLMSDEWLTVKTCIETDAFPLCFEFLSKDRGAKDAPNHFLGRTVKDWEFDEGTFDGIVSSFDPLGGDTQFEIYYEDGDSRWISLKHLRNILVKPETRGGAKKSRMRVSTTLELAPLSPLRILVLFSGTDSVGRFIRKHFPEAMVLNIDSDYGAPNATHVDLLEWNYRDMKPGFFEMIWASPPCTEFSRAKTVGIRALAEADRIVQTTLEIIAYFAPHLWFIENPVGLLRDRSYMKELTPLRQTTSYCLFGTPFRKNTDIWSSIAVDLSLQPCSASNPCKFQALLGRHPISAQQGSSPTFKSGSNTKALHQIPPGLLKLLFQPLLTYRGDDRSGHNKLATSTFGCVEKNPGPSVIWPSNADQLWEVIFPTRAELYPSLQQKPEPLALVKVLGFEDDFAICSFEYISTLSYLILKGCNSIPGPTPCGSITKRALDSTKKMSIHKDHLLDVHAIMILEDEKDLHRRYSDLMSITYMLTFGFHPSYKTHTVEQINECGTLFRAEPLSLKLILAGDIPLRRYARSLDPPPMGELDVFRSLNATRHKVRVLILPMVRDAVDVASKAYLLHSPLNFEDINLKFEPAPELPNFTVNGQSVNINFDNLLIISPFFEIDWLAFARSLIFHSGVHDLHWTPDGFKNEWDQHSLFETDFFHSCWVSPLLEATLRVHGVPFQSTEIETLQLVPNGSLHFVMKR